MVERNQETPTRVFVYGTLRPGNVLYHHISHAVLETIPDEITADLHISTNNWYPIAVPGTGNIIGTVLTIRPEYLKILDDIEGVPKLFDRHEIITKGGLQAYVYFGSGAVKGARIYHGDFNKFLQDREE